MANNINPLLINPNATSDILKEAESYIMGAGAGDESDTGFEEDSGYAGQEDQEGVDQEDYVDEQEDDSDQYQDASDYEEEDQDSSGDDEEEEDDLPIDKAPPALKKRLREQTKKNNNLKRELEEKNALLAKIIEKMQSADASTQPHATDEPDRELDPDGHAEWRDKQLALHQKQLSQQQLILETQSALAASESEARQSRPDYDDVKKFAREHIKRNVRFDNPSISDADLSEVIRLSFLDAAYQARQRGMSPAEFIIKKAELNGYVPQKNIRQRGDALKPKPDIAKINKNMETKKSLGALSGKGRGGTPTLQQIAEMSPSEISKLMRENPKAIYGQF